MSVKRILEVIETEAPNEDVKQVLRRFAGLPNTSQHFPRNSTLRIAGKFLFDILKAKEAERLRNDFLEAESIVNLIVDEAVERIRKSDLKHPEICRRFMRYGMIGYDESGLACFNLAGCDNKCDLFHPPVCERRLCIDPLCFQRHE